ncbi:hypothetical protein SAMN05443429_11259 [Cruoricaptor ignavus]|uniref:Uncharacterized protein n=1 Tax=Cruoricaptor ignavus TaxID=1118202 RepID=A0A1M6HH08_9FLAO|nr:hypothetical protein [Cruoricaptor ignavus]SHJ21483.1 hypothetical protein SAMN05443429_11259 [Cruoricaptor ignavus]
MTVIIEIKNIGGIWYVNGKRLGHDELTHAEMQALDNFYKELKNINP